MFTVGVKQHHNNNKYLHQVSRKDYKGCLSYRADTIYQLNFSKKQNSVKNIGGVTVLILCASSDDALYLYQVS